MVSAAIESALNRPVWSALTTGDRRFAEGGSLALRFPPDIAPFAATAEDSPEAFAALRELLAEDGRVALVTLDRLKPYPGFEVVREAPIIQMIADGKTPAPSEGPAPIVLGPSDVPEMLRLAEQTNPGPFGPRTHELGQYIGVRVDGALAAMAARAHAARRSGRDQRGLRQSRASRQRLCRISRRLACPQASRGGRHAFPARVHGQSRHRSL